MRQLGMLLFFTMASACGTSNAARQPVRTPVARAETPAPTPERRTQGVIARGELDVVLDRGLGYFLQSVETEPNLVGGQFDGFRVLQIRDPRFAEVDLLPGDVVRRINGSSIERPEHAFSVFEGLRVASELSIEYQRGEEERVLRFTIEDGSGGH